jgi:hypothetical protein
MTSQSPRIYTYKITFEEVPYYYYGMHEEKVYDEEYWGSPQTHKWMWDFYTPKKQILETFSTRTDAGEVERRLIKPVYNTDKWCLNENCGGVISLKTCSKAGKIGSSKNKENKVGIFSMTKKQQSLAGKRSYESRIKNGTDGLSKLTKKERQEHGSKMGKITYELKLGIHSLTSEELSEAGKVGYANGIGKLTKEEKSQLSKKNYELGFGIASLTPEERSEVSKKGGTKTYKQGKGCFSLTPEERSEITRKVNSQRWECCETGYVSTAAGIVVYQRARGIDTSKNNRRKIS